MSFEIDATIAGEDTNSYVDLAYADDYWEDHFSATRAAAWSALSDSAKTKALVIACRMVDSVRFTIPLTGADAYDRTMRFNPTSGVVWMVTDPQPFRSNPYQALQFPRVIDTNSTGALFIPEPIKMAQCEQAGVLLSWDDTALTNRMQGLTSDAATVGPISVKQTYSENGGGVSVIAPTVWEFIKPYVLKNSKSIKRA